MSSVAVIASSTATGASFTALTVMFRVPTSRQATVGDGVIDTIRAIEVSGRGIGVTTIGRNRNTATLGGGKGTGHDGEGITIDDPDHWRPGRYGVKRGIFRRGDRIIDRNRGIVDRIDRDVEGADIVRLPSVTV